MYFELKNIGAIKSAKIELGKFTLISGKNNTGMIQTGFDDAIVQINETSDKIAEAIHSQ